MALKKSIFILTVTLCGIISSEFLADAAAIEHPESEAPPDTINAPKKIIFDYSVDVEFDPADTFNATDGGLDIEIGSKEDEDASQWLVVTPSGYEYKGSPDVLRAIFAAANISLSGSLQDLLLEYGDPVGDDIKDGRSKRSVFYPDTRSRVYNPNLYFPYTAMGRIDYGCTGTFIGPRHILTAGHCVFNRWTNQWVTNLNFRRAKNCDPDSGVFYRWTRALTTIGWKIYGYESYDYGLIVVDRVSPYYMSYGYNNLISPGLTVNIAGYPEDKFGRCLWRTNCATQYHFTEELGYRCDTSLGMTGSAVYVYWSNTNRRIIYCVHTRGVSAAQYYNRCARITAPRFLQLQTWIKDY